MPNSIISEGTARQERSGSVVSPAPSMSFSAKDSAGVCCINGEPKPGLSKGECFAAGGKWKDDGKC